MKNTSLMIEEMGMMKGLSMMDNCMGSMQACMMMMQDMNMPMCTAKTAECIAMMKDCMNMVTNMNMMEEATAMMGQCHKMMMSCMMDEMMPMMMAKMKAEPMSTMTGMMAMASEMEMMRGRMMDMMASGMDMMMCMSMMQKMGMMMMDMDQMMMQDGMAHDAARMACMDMMKCLGQMAQCTMMMMNGQYTLKGVDMMMCMDASMMEMGMNEIRMAEMDMPGMMALRNEYARMKPLKGLKMAFSMHVTVQTAVMMKTMMMMGAEVRCCACNVNSTQEEAAAAMNGMGIPTFGMKGMTNDEMMNCMEMCLFMDEKMTMPVDMMMDSTGMMTQIMMQKHPDMMNRMMGMCMDSVMGMQMMNRLMLEGGLMMPVMNMNTSPRKAKVDYKYGSMETLVGSIRNLTGMMIAGKVCVIAGYGDMGKACAQAMKNAGARVIVTEIDPFCALEACMDGCMVMKMDDACKMADIIVTATENRDVLITRHFEMMKNNCTVCNMSDYDSEIDLVSLNEKYGNTKETMKPMVDRYRINGKNIYVLGEGMAVNMSSSMGYSSFIMSTCFTIQAMAIMDFYLNSKMYENKIYRMPLGLGVKAAKMHLMELGIELDMLTPEQEACMKEVEMMVPGMSMN